MSTLNDHDAMEMLQICKKMFAQITCFALVTAATFSHFMFFSKVIFVTLLKLLVKERPFPWQHVIPEKSDPRAIFCLSKQCKTNSWGLSCR